MIDELIDRCGIDLTFDKRRKPKVIRRLLELAASCGAIEERAVEALALQLLERDGEVSCAVGNGIAIPHRTSPLVRVQTIVFVRTRRATRFDAPDGLPVQLFFLMLAPENHVNAHLRALAALSRVLQQPAVRERLRTASDPSEIRTILADGAAYPDSGTGGRRISPGDATPGMG